MLVLAQSALDFLLPLRNKLCGTHCGEMHYGVGVITGLVHYAIFAMLVPLHSC